MKVADWAVPLGLGLAGALLGAGAVQKQSEDSVKIVDRHETILRDHETRLSKVEQLAGDTNDGVKELLRRIPRK
jgi:hypothetical protein